MTDERLREVLKKYRWSAWDEDTAATQAIADINVLWGEPVAWLIERWDTFLDEWVKSYPPYTADAEEVADLLESKVLKYRATALYARSNPDD